MKVSVLLHFFPPVVLYFYLYWTSVSVITDNQSHSSQYNSNDWLTQLDHVSCFCQYHIGPAPSRWSLLIFIQLTIWLVERCTPPPARKEIDERVYKKYKDQFFKCIINDQPDRQMSQKYTFIKLQKAKCHKSTTSKCKRNNDFGFGFILVYDKISYLFTYSNLWKYSWVEGYIIYFITLLCF